MAKESGFGMSVTVDDAGGTGRDISNDIMTVDFETPRNIQDITGLDKSATERLLLLADFSATLDGVFNATSNKSHDVFKLWATTTVARTTSIVHSGQTLAVEVWVLDYAVARADSGEMTWGTPMVLQDGAVPTWA